MEASPDVAAEEGSWPRYIELVIVGLVQHAAAFDRAAVSSYTTLSALAVTTTRRDEQVEVVRGIVIGDRMTR